MAVELETLKLPLDVAKKDKSHRDPDLASKVVAEEQQHGEI
jgi:hypothetical protein